MAKSRSRKEKGNEAAQPGAFQTHAGGQIHNANDPDDKVTQEIRRREARQKARRDASAKGKK